MRINQEQYGNRQATPRIRRLLEREGDPASFFYLAVSALPCPDEIRAVAADGHEIGITPGSTRPTRACRLARNAS